MGRLFDDRSIFYTCHIVWAPNPLNPRTASVSQAVRASKWPRWSTTIALVGWVLRAMKKLPWRMCSPMPPSLPARADYLRIDHQHGRASCTRVATRHTGIDGSCSQALSDNIAERAKKKKWRYSKKKKKKKKEMNIRLC